MKCTVCQGKGALGSLPCGRCAGKGRALNYALFDLLIFSLVVAGVVGTLGYAALTHQVDGPAYEELRTVPAPARTTRHLSVHW
jgi:hypothetical protein